MLADDKRPLSKNERLLAITQDNSWAHLHRGEHDALFGHGDGFCDGMDFFDDSARQFSPMPGEGGKLKLVQVDAAVNGEDLTSRLQKVMQRFVENLDQMKLTREQVGFIEGIEKRGHHELLVVLAGSPFSGESKLESFHSGSILHNAWHLVRGNHR